MKHTKNALHTPFPVEQFGNRVGRGQNNYVYGLPLEGRENDFVVKVNHEDKQHRSVTEVMQAVRYKKEKYEILKLFLGDLIPESGFVLGTKIDSKGPRTVEYTVQERVPKVYISQLSEQQLRDPTLVYNMMLLMTKLENMYRALGNINARTGGGVAQLDAKMDLGGISGYVREHINAPITYKTAQTSIDKKAIKETPNILVDPESLDIWCVDFDEGVWTSEMSDAKSMLLDFVAGDERTQQVIDLQASDLMARPELAKLAVDSALSYM